MDLLDLWRGLLTPRRCLLLIEQLPPGSRLGRKIGGGSVWSDAVSAIHEEGYLIRAGVMAALGVSRSDIPGPVEPPEAGWQEKAREAQEAERGEQERRGADRVARNMQRLLAQEASQDS